MKAETQMPRMGKIKKKKQTEIYCNNKMQVFFLLRDYLMA
jgi:hypothetical protein